MLCPSCGLQLPPGSETCESCRPPTSEGGLDAPANRSTGGASGTRFVRPRAVTALAALDLAAAGALLFLVLGFGASFFEGKAKDGALDLALGGGFALIAFGFLVAGVGLLGLRRLGRRLHLALAGLALPVFPIGTLAGALFLAYFLRPGVRTLFSEAMPAALAPAEKEAVDEARRASGLLVAATATASLPLVALLVLIVAAMTWPTFIAGGNERDESAALAELRRIAVAQRAYADLHGGRFDRLECLARPAQCRPAFPPSAAPFLPEALVGPGPRHGYRFVWHAGPEATAAGHAPSDASEGLSSYAVVAAPEAAADGARWFCADSSGGVCAATGRAPTQLDGRCPPGCETAP